MGGGDWEQGAKQTEKVVTVNHEGNIRVKLSLSDYNQESDIQDTSLHVERGLGSMKLNELK